MLITLSVSGACQIVTPITGAQSMGMGNTTACSTHQFSLFNNVAGLAAVTEFSAAVTQYAIPSFKPFGKIGAALNMPTGVGTAALGISRFGDNVFSEQIAMAAFANKFGLASLGTSLAYMQVKASGFGVRHALTIGFGGIAEITPRFFIGAYVNNLNQPRLSQESGERAPARFVLGTGWKFGSNVFATTEIGKSAHEDPSIKAGLQYRLNEKINVRTGFNLIPQTVFGGLGFRLKKFTIDYAAEFNQQLGTAHQASLLLSIKKKK